MESPKKAVVMVGLIKSFHQDMKYVWMSEKLMDPITVMA